MSPDEQTPVNNSLVVRATETGRYLNLLRPQGKVFVLVDPADFDPTWMERVDPSLRRKPGRR
jgi:hypothetical protein